MLENIGMGVECWDAGENDMWEGVMLYLFDLKRLVYVYSFLNCSYNLEYCLVGVDQEVGKCGLRVT
jgi:hypothetical protein